MLLRGGPQTLGDLLAKLPRLNPKKLEREGNMPLLLLEHLEVFYICPSALMISGMMSWWCVVEGGVSVIGGLWSEGGSAASAVISYIFSAASVFEYDLH